ncbi:hypothetical protein AKJ09_08756 [Labilithrix luteola]|uniref:Uncharacterized protein n=1 Tax=Labilithrix luteola TaxID=1391654 RepID=A0A0K1Q8M1_9BACT|nr:hypothetical protein [Labilithrix luteola]AKV02093.1 hypothetical protein AKJ09_08756 [Labilithrix luteola]
MAERDKPLPGDLGSQPTLDERAPEERAAERLRDTLETRGADGDPLAGLAQALHAAWSPSEIDPEEHRALVEACLDAADDAPPTEEELAAAERLRASLDSRTPRAPDHAEAELALSLRAAWSPEPLTESAHRVVVDDALAAKNVVVALPARRAIVRRFYAGAAGVVALAAGLLLWLNMSDHASGEAPLAAARSTQSLFDEPFKPGETSARIDRIASARSSDFRENRFAQWGVR